MGDARVSDDDRRFAERVVERGLASRAKVEESLAGLLRMLEGGASPAPTLSRMLVENGTLTSAQAEAAAAPAEQIATVKRPSGVDLGAAPSADRYQKGSAFDSRYAVAGELARGGMGIILDGKDLEIRRELAIKVLIDEQNASPAQAAKFVEEAQIQGQLEHPNICPVHELGVDGKGRLFFTMKKVKGKSLHQILSDPALEHAYTPARLLEIFTKVCDAVAFAHSRGVIHRDLKPENIMIGEFGEVQVMDWGLAKVVGREDRRRDMLVVTDRVEGGALRSMEGSVMGTPAFMPPEQATGRVDDIDERSDIYALGGILYALLTRRAPIEGSGVLDVLKSAAENRIIPPSRRTPGRPVPADLEAAAMKALAADRAARYPSVRDFRADIAAFLEGRTLAAADYSLAQIALKWIRRNRVFAATAGAAALLLLALGAFYLVDVTRARNAARAQAIRAGAAEADAKNQAKEAERQRRAAEISLGGARVAEGDALSRSGRPGEAKQRYEHARAILREAGASAIPADTGLMRLHRSHPPALITRRTESGERFAVAVSPDGRTLAVGNRNAPCLELLELPSARRIASWPDVRRSVTALAFSPDGRRLLVGSLDDRVRLYDVAGGRELRALAGHGGDTWSVAFSPDGRHSLSHGGDGVVRLWDIEAAAELRTFLAHRSNLSNAVFSPDGRHVLAPAPNSELKLWDAASGALVRTFKGHASIVISVAFSRDGALLASGSHDKTIRLWETATGADRGTLAGHTGFVKALEFSADGRRLLSSGWDRTLRLWDVESRREARVFSEHVNRVIGLGFIGDGRRAVSVSDDGALKLWDAKEAPAPPPGAGAAAFSDDGRILALVHHGSVELIDAATQRSLRRLPAAATTCAAFLPGGRLLLTGGADRRIRAWDVVSGREAYALEGHAAGVSCVAVCAKGCHAASGGADGSVHLWLLEERRPGRVSKGHRSRVSAVGFLGCGRLASSGHDSQVSVWTVDTGAEEKIQLEAVITGFAFAGEGKRAVGATYGVNATVVDLTTQKIVGFLDGHTAGLGCVAVSGDGRLALTGSWDGTARLWDLPGGVEIRTFTDHADSVSVAAFSPNGRYAFCSSADAARLWDLDATSRFWELAALRAQADRRLAEAPDDREALAVLGGWYGFRRAGDWAVELLEKARTAGASVSALTLARAYWDADRPKEALREFERALREKEAPETYLKLCAEAVRQP